MGRRTDSRFRMIETAGELFRQRGFHATALSDVVEASGAPRGSIYFHFPGGKQELAREAIARAADEIEAIVDRAADGADSPAALVANLGDLVVQRLENSAYQDGCAIATMVLELAPADTTLSAEFDEGFRRWRAALVERFESGGIPPERAPLLANLVMSGFEGALIISRAARDTEAIRHTTVGLVEILEREAPRPGGLGQPRRPR